MYVYVVYILYDFIWFYNKFVQRFFSQKMPLNQ